MPQRFDPETERYVSLVTYRRNGVEVATPIWFASANGNYYAFSAANAGKVKRLKNNPSIRMAACDIRGKVRVPWIDGKACVVTTEATLTHAYSALRTKYGWQMKIGDTLAKLSGRYAKRAMIEIQLEDNLWTLPLR